MKRFLLALFAIGLIAGVSTSCKKTCTCTVKTMMGGTILSEISETHEITQDDKNNGYKKCSDFNGETTTSDGETSLKAVVSCK